MPTIARSTRRFLLCCVLATVTANLSCGTRSADAPNILLILVDTLRADHLGFYGYDRDTSPTLDALASRGIVFDNARSVSNWTNPTIQSLFSGRWPLSVVEEAPHRQAIRLPLHPTNVTLAEHLSAAGYRTAALVDHPGIGPGLGFDQGFDRFVRLYEQGSEGGRGWSKSNIWYVANELRRVIADRDQRPWFTYLHVVYPHHPYQAPKRYQGLFGDDQFDDLSPAFRDQIVASYDNQIRRTDDLVSLLLEELELHSQLEDTWIIVTADHGESLFERSDRSGHGAHFYEEVVRVPLLIVPPQHASEPRRVSDPVLNLDLFPTVLQIAGMKTRPESDGVALPLGNEATTQPTRRAQLITNPHGYDPSGAALVAGGWKYVEQLGRPGDGRRLLFDLHRDPAEASDLLAVEQERAALLAKALAAHRLRSANRLAQLNELPSPGEEPDPETIEALRTMGYLD